MEYQFHTIASPLDKEIWINRLVEEYKALINYVERTKANNTDWFTLESNEEGTLWKGACWYFQDKRKYTFDLEISVPIAYPYSPPEIKIPELADKTEKMFRGCVICTESHFVPLWQSNAPRFGIIHALIFGLAPWIAVEIPDLIREERIK